MQLSNDLVKCFTLKKSSFIAVFELVSQKTINYMYLKKIFVEFFFAQNSNHYFLV